MQPPSGLSIRRAAPADYSAYAQLFPELLSGDAVPLIEAWLSAVMPSTWVAVLDDRVVGYCYCQDFDNTGYVRNIVVAPHARRRGVGRALMDVVADHLRSLGKSYWRLSVKTTNHPALALYARLGMRPAYLCKSIRLPWTSLVALPEGNATVRELQPGREGLLESVFRLPAGQLTIARHAKRLLLEAVSTDELEPIGIAAFDSGFPGALPFRVRTLDAVAPLLSAIRRTVPEHSHINLVAENDEPLAALLLGSGATLRDELLLFRGELAASPQPS